MGGDGHLQIYQYSYIRGRAEFFGERPRCGEVTFDTKENSDGKRT